MKPLAAYYSTCLLLLLSIIILSQQIHSIEAARGFKLINQNTLHSNTAKGSFTTIVAEVEETAITSPPPATSEPQQPPAAAAPGRGTDDFRPTTPGHSPGVGHSTHN
ncbi:unnamed protein product [Linum tenue]|uniref:Encoded peptide n=1 Tax=Linum tenue TaxID=586396 RepID=A0AAV0L6V7_9ROSI|nr:unnamed protein product [Linum tenue]CAI0429931.1 unnamed protein product [Linum tenue]